MYADRVVSVFIMRGRQVTCLVVQFQNGGHIAVEDLHTRGLDELKQSLNDLKGGVHDRI